MCYNMLMEKLKTKLRRFVYFLKNQWLNFDNVVLTLALIFCAVWTYAAINSMSRNWNLSENLTKKQNELKILELEVDSLKLENQYYASEEYQELSVRAKMNKKSSGETMIYLPDNSEYAKNKHQSKEMVVLTEKSNLAKWLSFLLGV